MAIYKVDSLTKPKWPTHSELYSQKIQVNSIQVISSSKTSQYKLQSSCKPIQNCNLSLKNVDKLQTNLLQVVIKLLAYLLKRKK